MRRLPASSSFRTRLPFSRPRRLLVPVLLASAALAACSPEYDWRQIRPSEDHYVALMPGKPARLSQAVNLDGMKVSMTMRGARVGDVAFTVAATELPSTSSAVGEQAVAAMRAAMVRNIAGRETDAQAVAVPVVDSNNRPTGSARGWRVDAAGQASGRDVELHAIFAARGGWAWQAVVLGPAPDREQTKQFLDGFRLTE